jgi:hypothetical protein
VSPEKQRIAIAEACGWKKEIFLPVSDCSEAELILGYDEITEIWKSPNGQYVRDAFFPDYLSDLNAMHEAVMSLPSERRVEYRKQLKYIVAPRTKPARAGGLVFMGDKEYDAWFNATAAQRAEAFLRTLNLWTDAQ